jgi:hypothetical protein
MIYVYNKDNVANMAVYPFVNFRNGSGSRETLVLSTVGLPIAANEHYKARIAVTGNGLTGFIEKEFTSDSSGNVVADDLYSTDPENHLRYLTLTQVDLPPELIETFVEVTGISLLAGQDTITSVVESNYPDGGNPQLKIKGALNLNGVAIVSPSNASKKSPITWTVIGGATGSVSLNPTTSVLTVEGIANPGYRTVTLQATIPGGAGNYGSLNFTTPLTVTLDYFNVFRTQKVTTIYIDPPPPVEEGSTLNLPSLVTFYPSDPYIENRGPVTPADIVWTISSSTSTGSIISGATFTAGTPGTVTVTATLPANANGGTPVTKDLTITVVTRTNSHVDITGMDLYSGAQYLDFTTRNEEVNGSKVRRVVDGGDLNLLSSLIITPANATVATDMSKRSMEIAAPDMSYVQPGSTPAHLKVREGIAPPPPGTDVKVRVIVADAMYDSGTYSVVPYSSHLAGDGFSITLRETHNNNLVNLNSDFSLDGATIQVGQTLDLRDLVHMASSMVSVNDLTWQATTSTLSGSLFTPVSAGPVTITATVPDVKNAGVSISRTATLTVNPAPPVYPSAFTLRIIKVNNTSDYVKQIALVPVASDSYSADVYRTGHTGVRWATGSGKLGATTLTNFKKQYPQAQFITIGKIYKANDWSDVVIDWPASGGYNLFFIEGDSRVRGYVTPGQMDPDQNKNFLFYLRPDYLYDNQRLWMSAYLENNPVTGASRVIPVGYHSYDNTASIMKSQGVGSLPKHDIP